MYVCMYVCMYDLACVNELYSTCIILKAGIEAKDSNKKAFIFLLS